MPQQLFRRAPRLIFCRGDLWPAMIVDWQRWEGIRSPALALEAERRRWPVGHDKLACHWNSRDRTAGLLIGRAVAQGIAAGPEAGLRPSALPVAAIHTRLTGGIPAALGLAREVIRQRVADEELRIEGCWLAVATPGTDVLDVYVGLQLGRDRACSRPCEGRPRRLYSA